MAMTRAGRAERHSTRTGGVSPSISVSAARFAAIGRYLGVIEGLLCDDLVTLVTTMKSFEQISKMHFREKQDVLRDNGVLNISTFCASTWHV